LSCASAADPHPAANINGVGPNIAANRTVLQSFDDRANLDYTGGATVGDLDGPSLLLEAGEETGGGDTPCTRALPPSVPESARAASCPRRDLWTRRGPPGLAERTQTAVEHRHFPEELPAQAVATLVGGP
jgi:hypothetical protein